MGDGLKNTGLAVAVATAICSALVSAKGNAQVAKADFELLVEPSGTPSKQSLKAGAAVKVLRRNGFWVEIEGASGVKGWAKAASIDFSNAAKGPVAIDTGRLGSGNIVATSAARGLSAKDLQQGSPNIKAVEKLDAIVAQALPVKVFRDQAGIIPAAGNFALAVPPPRSADTAPPPAAASNGQPAKPQPSSKPKAKKDDDDW